MLLVLDVCVSGKGRGPAAPMASTDFAVSFPTDADSTSEWEGRCLSRGGGRVGAAAEGCAGTVESRLAVTVGTLLFTLIGAMLIFSMTSKCSHFISLPASEEATRS